MVVLRLDPLVPVVWRDPHTLQLGGEPPLLVFEGVAPHEERMLAALASGVPRTALAAIGPCPLAVVDGFLERVRPFLTRRLAPSEAFVIRARGANRQLIGGTARALGLLARADAAARRAGIVIGMHAIPPADYRDWLRRDVPHIGVVFGDERVLVGPVVAPGRTACLRCADLWRRDADPDWPALASQLIERPAASALDPILRAEALGAAARLLAAAAAANDERGPHGLILTARGRAERPPVVPHPECGCTVDLQASLD